MTREQDAERAVTSVVDAWGTLDILINNAGISIHEPAEDISIDDVQKLYDIDVFGIFRFCQAAFKPMARQKQGSIINIASMAGIVGVGAPTSAYNSAKAAVIMLTKTLAVEWAPHNIRVNAIAPGYMLSPRVSELQERDPAEYENWVARVPMKRAGEPVELQGLAVYMASDASGYMTGSTVVIDGGYTSA